MPRGPPIWGALILKPSGIPALYEGVSAVEYRFRQEKITALPVFPWGILLCDFFLMKTCGIFRWRKNRPLFENSPFFRIASMPNLQRYRIGIPIPDGCGSAVQEKPICLRTGARATGNGGDPERL